MRFVVELLFMFRCDSKSCEEQQKWPIVYSKSYNVHFCGVERLHPFDAAKWENIYKVRYIYIIYFISRLTTFISFKTNNIRYRVILIFLF